MIITADLRSAKKNRSTEPSSASRLTKTGFIPPIKPLSLSNLSIARGKCCKSSIIECAQSTTPPGER
jgi:hypothetical protein